MNKSELVDAIASGADISKASAGRALDSMVETITESLKKGDPVALVGFGTFSVKDRAARQGRNPQTGATIQIPAARVPGFKAGKGLKDSIILDYRAFFYPVSALSNARYAEKQRACHQYRKYIGRI